MSRSSRAALLPLLLLFARPGLAHEGAIHAMGTVKEITAARIVVTTPEGDKAFTIGPQTRFLRGKSTAAASDVHSGERVAVHARAADGGAAAYEVKLPASPAPAAQP
ncbi:MAG: DUF5666 domain-containing protein [Anaeromyxobacter sp.]